MPPPRTTLGALLRAATTAIARYTGTLLAMFVVQSILAGVVLVAIAVVVSLAFSHLPLWDDAVDGDLVALVACLRFASANALAAAGIAFAAALLWALASWFVVGGIYGVLAERPEGRIETARCFGASGAATYLRYARLALWSLPNWLAVAIVLAACTSAAAPSIEYALTMGDLAVALAVALLPALLLFHVLRTVGDYARAALALRLEDHGRGVLATYISSFVFVIRNPLALLHSGLGWIGFAIVTVVYSYFASDHPMFGTNGAIALFVIRHGVALARAAIRFGVLAGQVELAKSRSPAVRTDAETSV